MSTYREFESQATELMHLIVTSVEYVKDTHVGLVLSPSSAAPEMFHADSHNPAPLNTVFPQPEMLFLIPLSFSSAFISAAHT